MTRTHTVKRAALTTAALTTAAMGTALALLVPATAVATPAGPPRTGQRAPVGDVRTFGSDAFGQLGNGAGGASYAPMTVLSDVVDVAGGREHVLALKANGDVYAWGSDMFGQVGNLQPFANTPSPALVLTGAATVAAGHLHSLALLTGGGVRAWGDNDKGQAGPAGGTKRKAAAPLAVSGLPAAATQVAAGRAHSLALVGGSLYTWGDNTFGQLGLGSKDTARHPKPTKVPGLPSLRFVAGGRDSTYAIDTAGNLWAWGRNTFGQIGNGSTLTVLTPVKVLSGVRQVEAGANHTVAVLLDGRVMSWGQNTSGQLGYPGGNRSTPTEVTAVSGAAWAYVGRDHTIAGLDDGQVLTWGRNDGGQLGLDPAVVTSTSTPTVIPSLAGSRDAGGGEMYSVVLG